MSVSDADFCQWCKEAITDYMGHMCPEPYEQLKQADQELFFAKKRIAELEGIMEAIIVTANHVHDLSDLRRDVKHYAAEGLKREVKP